MGCYTVSSGSPAIPPNERWFMSTDPFPCSGPDDPGLDAWGEQPAGHGPGEQSAAGNGPEDDWDPEAHLAAVIAAADAGQYLVPDWSGEDLPAGFTPGGTADLMGPGPVLAALVHAAVGRDGAALAGLPDDELLRVIRAARRMESRAVWTGLAAVREFAARRPADLGPSSRCGFAEFAAEELAWDLNLTTQAAETEMAYACSVAGRLPATFAALGAGQIHPVHVLIIADQTAVLSPQDAARADEVLAAAAQSKTFGQLRYAAHRLVLKLDPDAARRWKEEAKKDAHVRRFREDSGNAGMVAREMPPDETLASWQHIEQRALDLRAAGVAGTLQELRVRAFLDLLQERDTRDALTDPGADQAGGAPGSEGGPRDGGDGPAGHSPGGDSPGDSSGPGGPGGDSPGGGSGSGGPGGDSPGGGSGSGGPGGSGPAPRGHGPTGTGPDGHARAARDTGPSIAAQVNITVPLGTALGRSDVPGDVAGFGLVDAETARDLLAAAARHPDTRWCLTALHPDGTAAAHGCASGRRPWPPDPGPPGSGPPDSGPPGSGPPGSGPPGSGPADPGPPGSGPPDSGPPRGSDPPGPPGLHDPPEPPGPPRDGGPPGPPGPPDPQAAEFLRRLNVTLSPVIRGPCDHAQAEDGYRPSRKLQHLVNARSPRCSAPGCGRPAARCDLDHSTPWHRGGLTCPCNLAPLCRRHHRCKQSQGWKLEQVSPGVLAWRTPSGLTYTTTPAAYPM
jgi:Domain of unknown function (DUF222)